MVKWLYLRHCYWDLDIAYTKRKLTILSISSYIQYIEHILSFRKIDFNQSFSLFFWPRISRLILYTGLNFFRDVKNIPLGEMCLTFFIEALVFVLFEKNGKLVVYFLNFVFLDFINKN